MKQNYKKTLWGSIIAFILGTSCCWLSSLAIWVGGATFIGVVANYINNIQMIIIAIGVILGVITLYLYLKKGRKV